MLSEVAVTVRNESVSDVWLPTSSKYLPLFSYENSHRGLGEYMMTEFLHFWVIHPFKFSMYWIYIYLIVLTIQKCYRLKCKLAFFSLYVSKLITRRLGKLCIFFILLVLIDATAGHRFFFGGAQYLNRGIHQCFKTGSFCFIITTGDSFVVVSMFSHFLLILCLVFILQICERGSRSVEVTSRVFLS